MLRAKAGDDVSFDTLMRELQPWLIRYFKRRLSFTDAEDATQEALLAVQCRRFTYDARGPFAPWIATIARYKWIDHLRRKLRVHEVPLDEHIPINDHGEAVVCGVVLETLFAEMKPAQVEAIRCTKLRGASVAEAAEATGQSPSLVKVNVHRGMKRASRHLLA